MRVGLSSWTYSWNIGVAGYPAPAQPFSAFDLVKQAARLGAQVVQIADNLPLDALSDEELSSLHRSAQDAGIALEVGTRGVRPEALLPYLDIAQRLDSPLVRTLLHDAKGCPTLAQAEADLRALLPELHARGLTLAIENHDFFAVADLRDLILRIGDPCVRVCLDPVNNLAQGESTNDVFAALADLTVNFHCKDYTIRRKPSNLGFDVEGCAAGDGLLNLPRCAGVFASKNLSFIVELWTPWQDDIQKTCALEEQWAQRSMQALLALGH